MSEPFQLYDPNPDVRVLETEYKRLLGFPPDYGLEGRTRELAEEARSWYERNGRPWIYAGQARGLDLPGRTLRLDEREFRSRTLFEQFEEARAHSGVVALVSAGGECEERARELWEQEKPDEYFFLEIFGSAVVEHLVTGIGARLCAWAEPRGLAVLPHYSPGYTGWEVADQVPLFQVLAQLANGAFPREIRVRESGMLQPKKSLLALFGLTRHRQRVAGRPTACESCAFAPCQYRRAPYRAARLPLEDIARLQPSRGVKTFAARRALNANAQYSLNLKALKKWSRERLTITNGSGGVEAVFRYEGTTCSNLGHPLAFDYRVRLAPANDRYRILDANCAPAPGDAGHKMMCAYLNNPEQVMGAIVAPIPLLGRPLDDVLAWNVPQCPSACYCAADSHLHKWRLVLQVLHYALAQGREGEGRSASTTL